jgi:hypothetical protein
MMGLRRRYSFVMDQLEKLTPAQRVGYPNAKFRSDFLAAGELEAFARMVRSYDLVDQPPPGWQPRDPETLLLPEERSRR